MLKILSKKEFSMKRNEYFKFSWFFIIFLFLDFFLIFPEFIILFYLFRFDGGFFQEFKNQKY